MNDCVYGNIEDTTELNHVYHTNRLYHSDEFETLLERSGADLSDESELDRVLEFMSYQCGDWFSRWVCSPADRPDEEAQDEFDSWELIWRAFAQCHYKNRPDRLENLTSRHIAQRNERLLRHVRNLNESKPLRRSLINFSYRLSRCLNSMGLHQAAKQILSSSIYPRGSVGSE